MSHDEVEFKKDLERGLEKSIKDKITKALVDILSDPRIMIAAAMGLNINEHIKTVSQDTINDFTKEE